MYLIYVIQYPEKCRRVVINNIAKAHMQTHVNSKIAQNRKTIVSICMVVLVMGSLINIAMIINKQPAHSQNTQPIEHANQVNQNVRPPEFEIQINIEEPIHNIKLQDAQTKHDRTDERIQNQTQAQTQRESDVEIAIPHLSKEKQAKQKQYYEMQVIYQTDKEQLTQQQISANVELRTRMQRPKPAARRLRMWIIASAARSHLCAIMNAVNILTPVSIKTIFRLIRKGKINSVLIVSDRLDNFAKELIANNLKLLQDSSVRFYDADADSDYNFILASLSHQKCSQIVYLSHNFQISSEQATAISSIAEGVTHSNVLFSQNAIIQGQNSKLINLATIDLYSLHPSQFNKYLCMFNIKYFSLVSPLNFAYYAKFTIEQMLLIPVLALAQRSNCLAPFPQLAHSFNQSIVQFKQFEIRQPQSQNNSVCFVSYPSDPYIAQPIQILRYLKSIEAMNISALNVSVIIFIPYQFSTTNSLKQVLHFIMASSRNENITRFRINMRYNKSVSSLSTYQAAYSYCPKKSLIVSNRHNIQFIPNFAQSLSKSTSQYYHYYFVNFINQKDQAVNFTRAPLWDMAYFFRQKSTLFRTHFHTLQIFKSDFLKTNYFWTLKSAQIDFYETEASFVVPLLQMVRLNFYIINQTLFKVHERSRSENQLKQINNLRKYYQWTPLIDNRLYPFRYNCLTNQAFRRFAREKIPRIIHQVWIGAQIIPFRWKLHETLKQVNSDFEVVLWRKQNITSANFPLTFALIKRTLQYQKSTERSYLAPIASLMRYEAIHNIGGIYFDFKTEGLKPMNSFLKYQIFFTDASVTKLRFGSPDNVGNPMMGATRHNYYLKFVLTQLITQSKVDYNVKKFPAIVGAYILRKSLSDQQFFTVVGFGFHLLSPRPQTDDVNQCGMFSSFGKDQQVFDVSDERTKTQYRIGIPCKQYPEAYALMYKPLGRTWVAKKR